MECLSGASAEVREREREEEFCSSVDSFGLSLSLLERPLALFLSSMHQVHEKEKKKRGLYEATREEAGRER